MENKCDILDNKYRVSDILKGVVSVLQKLFLILVVLMNSLLFSNDVLSKFYELYSKRDSAITIPLQSFAPTSYSISDFLGSQFNPVSDYSFDGVGANINDSLYTVGPGDAFIIYLWGQINKSFTCFIDHDGNLPIVSVGVLSLKNQTLAKAKENIIKFLAAKFKNAQITISLSKVRKVKIDVLGEVNRPGTYIVSAGARISDIIGMANGFKENSNINGRAIRITNTQFGDRDADIISFYNTNNNDKNYYIREGDGIFVSKRNQSFSISGAVAYPDSFDFVEGDRLDKALDLAGGLTRGADSNSIILYRFLNNYDSLQSFVFSLKQINDSIVVIRPDDRILIPEQYEFRISRNVSITGEVFRPGLYPIQNDKTRLIDIINMAGGLTSQAFLQGSRIVRKAYTKTGEKEFQRLMNLPAQNLTPLERSFLKTKLTEENGTVSIDFDQLFSSQNALDNVYNIILREKDEIFINRKSLTVQVNGAVISPGLVSFKEGANYRYYINQTRGFNDKAKKGSVYIIKGGTETMLRPTKVKQIEPGDAIWVPETEYRDPWQVAKDIILTVGGLATTVLAVMSITEKL
ncbi:MAG: SLBB domain-containing protein [Chitinivibrionales bacterium]|nr:SLBB domain-containing protein [Chitinivibrionales bacterium]